jgi:hypothetical protein
MVHQTVDVNECNEHGNSRNFLTAHRTSLLVLDPVADLKVAQPVEKSDPLKSVLMARDSGAKGD